MTRTTVENHCVSWRDTYSYIGGCTDSSSSSARSQSWQNTKVGDRNPNRRMQIARGLNASTDYTVYRRTFSMPSPEIIAHAVDRQCATIVNGKWVYKYPEERRKGNLANLTIPGTPTDLSLTVADNLARMQFFKSVRKQQTVFQGGVFMLELGETLRMMKGATRNLLKRVLAHDRSAKRLVKRIRRRRGETMDSFVRRRSAALADSYLESVFGWRPFMSDIGSANDYLEKRLEKVDPTEPVSGRGEEQWFSSEEYSSGSGATTAWCTRNYVSLSRVRYYGRIKANLVGRPLYMESSLLGVDLTNFIPTVYEATPWSFFLDYFTNVGDVIDAWSNWSTGLLWSSKTVYQERKMHITNWRWVNSAPGTYLDAHISSNGKNVATNQYIRRYRTAGVEPPGLMFRVPGTAMTWLNVAALARSVLPR